MWLECQQGNEQPDGNAWNGVACLINISWWRLYGVIQTACLCHGNAGCTFTCIYGIFLYLDTYFIIAIFWYSLWVYFYASVPVHLYCNDTDTHNSPDLMLSCKGGTAVELDNRWSIIQGIMNWSGLSTVLTVISSHLLFIYSAGESEMWLDVNEWPVSPLLSW